jgi:hypothetical protein
MLAPTGSESALASARRSSEQIFEASTRSARSMRGAVGSHEQLLRVTRIHLSSSHGTTRRFSVSSFSFSFALAHTESAGTRAPRSSNSCQQNQRGLTGYAGRRHRADAAIDGRSTERCGLLAAEAHLKGAHECIDALIRLDSLSR